jgi:hypothetical protein
MGLDVAVGSSLEESAKALSFMGVKGNYPKKKIKKLTRSHSHGSTNDLFFFFPNQIRKNELQD